MRTDIDHLSATKQRELARVVETLFAEFEEAMCLATSKRKKAGRILKIILFGAGTRDGSGYDLLIVVNHHSLKKAVYWHKADDRIDRDPAVETPVCFIVHTLAEVNDALAKGRDFFAEIHREGIALYELPGHKLVAPKPLTAADAYRAAREHFLRWLPSARFFRRSLFATALASGRSREAAFLLHQATEYAYQGLLLVLTNYSPETHKVDFLRSWAEAREPRLIDVWPRETRQERRRFDLLTRAYAQARYSKHYWITRDELEWLDARVGCLHALVRKICIERLAALRAEAGAPAISETADIRRS